MAISRFDQNNYLPYENMEEKLEVVKKRLNRPLTMSEKIVYSHLDDPVNQVHPQTVSIQENGMYIHILAKCYT